MEDLNTMLSSSPWGSTSKAWIGLSATLQWTWVDGKLAKLNYWTPTFSSSVLDSVHSQMCMMISFGVWRSASCSTMKPSVCFDGE